ncbi:MAG: transposase [Betaproteobacteria bacterium]
MPRRPRAHLDGVPLHIVQRGHNREPCFFAEEDYLCYLHWLARALADADCALHAYVLMTNHVHLLLTPRQARSVPRLVIALGRRYVQYVNRTYRRTGTLWDSRYKSSLVQAETYLLACQRYIELNPCAPRWWTIRRTIAGPATGRTGSGCPMHCSRRTRCIGRWGRTGRAVRRHTARCSARNWMPTP